MDDSCSSLQRLLLTPEQATAACETWRRFYEQVWLPLHVPDRTAWQQALSFAIQDTREACASSFHFWVLTLRPVVLLVRMTLQWMWQVIWKYIIVKGISQQGVLYVKKAGRRWYQWQRSLTREQLVMELILIVSVVALYYLHRFLQRQTYFQRLSAWVRAKVRVLQLYYDRSKRATAKSYERTVRNIATTSLRLAVMMPHLLFWGFAATTKWLLPSLFQWLACDTALLPVLRLWYPVIATLLLLHDMKLVNQQQPKTTTTTTSATTQTPQRKTSSSTPRTPLLRMFPRTTPATEHRKRREVNEMKDRETYWLQFWMTNGAFLCVKSVWQALPFVAKLVNRTWMVQFELLFYVWVFVMPYLLPQIAHAPEGKPLALLEPHIRRVARMVYLSTQLFSDTWWETWVLRPLTTTLNLLVTLRMLSQHFADELRNMVTQSKALLLPSLSLFMPRFLSIFGLLFVQYALPLYKQSTLRKERLVMLRYWVIHIVLSAITQATDAILWWIPLSRVVIFVAFVVIGTSQAVVDMCIRMILHDLEVFRLLPSTEEQPEKSSWASRGVHALLERLPKAKEDPSTPAKEEEIRNAVHGATLPSIDSDQEQDDAVLYASSEDDPYSSSEGSHTKDESKSASKKRSPKRSRTKAKGVVDKENEGNVRRSGRHRTRTEGLAS